VSRRKADGVYDSIYAPFLNNPKSNRKALIERMYIRVLTELSCNRFKWVGLPDSIDTRFLELTLFNKALAVFYFDKEFDRYLCLQAAGTGKVNMYDNPTTFTVIGNTMGGSKTLTAKECVPIWSNYLRVPDWDIVMVYATRLAQLDRTIEINLDAMRYNYMVFVDENERQSYVNIMRQHTEGQPIIFGTSQLGQQIGEKIQAFPVSIDKDVVLNLQLSKSKLWNECMTMLGINNANQDKKERLVAAEVGANDDQVAASRGISLNSRQYAAEQINKMFDLSVSVRWDMDSEGSSMPDGMTITRGLGSGNIYSDS